MTIAIDPWVSQLITNIMITAVFLILISRSHEQRMTVESLNRQVALLGNEVFDKDLALRLATLVEKEENRPNPITYSGRIV